MKKRKVVATMQQSVGSGFNFDINDIPKQIKEQVEYHKNQTTVIKITDDRSAEKIICIEQVDESKLKLMKECDLKREIPYSESKQRFNIQGPILKQSKNGGGYLGKKINPQRIKRTADMISSFDLNDQSEYNDMPGGQHSILAMS